MRRQDSSKSDVTLTHDISPFTKRALRGMNLNHPCTYKLKSFNVNEYRFLLRVQLFSAMFRMLFWSFRCLLQTPTTKFPNASATFEEIHDTNSERFSLASLTCSTFQGLKNSTLGTGTQPDTSTRWWKHIEDVLTCLVIFGVVPKSRSFFKHSNDVYSLPLLFFKSLSIHDRKKHEHWHVTHWTHHKNAQTCANFFGMAFLPTASHLSLTFWHSSPRS